jgi:gas vesicle protein
MKINKKVTKKTVTMLDRLPKSKGDRLEFIIKNTKKAIFNEKLDSFLTEQLERLQKELKQWKRANN